MYVAITLRYDYTDSKEIFKISKNIKDICDRFNITLVPVVNFNTSYDYLNFCDALIITGSGTHVNPALYNSKEEINYNSKYLGEDKLDYQLIKYFHENNKPILGICRGLQILNVYFGGTLKQKVNNHDGKKHFINITSNSFLNNIYNKKQIVVNSTHTQSIKQLANNFIVSAISNDNIIEAIEYKNIYGVQWHPEYLVDYEIFNYFFKQIKNHYLM